MNEEMQTTELENEIETMIEDVDVDADVELEPALSPAALAAAYYTEATSYNVTLGNDTQIIEGRLEAVAAAKDMSIEHDRRVTVERTDGRVLMHFSNGSLDSFVWETRPGK